LYLLNNRRLILQHNRRIYRLTSLVYIQVITQLSNLFQYQRCNLLLCHH
jgi:hypothetical protein